MEIIKNGSWDKAEEYYNSQKKIIEFECAVCGCQFNADLTKGECTVSSVYEYAYALCPFCKHKVSKNLEEKR